MKGRPLDGGGLLCWQRASVCDSMDTEATKEDIGKGYDCLEDTADQQLKPSNKALAAVLLSGAFLAILNQTLLATAIPQIMRDLSLTENTAQWLTTIFMLVNGIMIPISAFLTATFTARKLFLFSMASFAVGTVICAIAPNFFLLIVGRIIQAAGAGILMPLMMTIFLFIFPIHKRGTAMGMVGLVISFAPAIGPALSGWIIEQYPWRALFYIILPLILIDMVIAYFVMKNVTEQTYPKLDVFSLILSTLGFGGLLYGFSSAGNEGWSSRFVLASLTIGTVSLIVFIWRQLKLAEPMLDFRILRYRTFALTTGIGMIGFISMIGSETILPIYMQNMAGYSALQSGLVLMPGAIVMGIMSPINGRIFDRIGGRWLILTGMMITVLTTVGFTGLSEDTSLVYLSVMFALRMLGISMVMMPSTTAGLNVLPPQLLAHGTAMNNTMRQVAASIGTAILITIMTSSVSSSQGRTPAAMIHGVNVAFWAAVAISLGGLILGLFVYDRKPEEARTS